jgi:hypothetical protein
MVNSAHHRFSSRCWGWWGNKPWESPRLPAPVTPAYAFAFLVPNELMAINAPTTITRNPTR